MFLLVFLLLASLYSHGADNPKKATSGVDEITQGVKKYHFDEQGPSNYSDSSANESDDESEEEAASPALPVTVTPRHAQLLFDGYGSMVAIASAINAETAGLYFSFYELSPYLSKPAFEDSFNPIISSLYQKRAEDIERNILLDKENERTTAILQKCTCTTKRAKQGLTKHHSLYAHALHQKIYLFQNAYKGEPVCFIGSHNPTQSSVTSQHNSMLMISGNEVYEQLKRRFDILFSDYADETEKYKLSKHAKTEFLQKNTDPSIPSTINDSDVIELAAGTELTLFKTPLAEDDGDEIVDGIVELIDNEDEELYYMHYRLTDAKIVYALRKAISRGVDVHIMIDDSGLAIDHQSNIHKTGHLAFKKLHELMAQNPHCSLGVITRGASLMLHDKTLACKNNGEGLIVVGSWNTTGSSTRYSCETSISCEGNALLYEKIKQEFERLKTLKINSSPASSTYYQSSEALMNDAAFKARLTAYADHKQSVSSNSYKINNWQLSADKKHVTLNPH